MDDADRSLQTQRVLAAVKKYWGFDTLRPMQHEAILAGLAKRDSLVVMPTGGGKSLCYQVPPLLINRMAVVVSPLIALMKDQVDGLKLNGYPAAAIHGNLSTEEIQQAEQDALAGNLKLLFVAPERLLTSRFLNLVTKLGIDSFAIDEAHCISQWGHDFRPEYRRLMELRRRVPGCSLHAFTATATPRVREDIAEQLQLRDPVRLVGIFDRPNLTYRITPRTRLDQQLAKVVGAHKGSAVIVYCLSRKDTEAAAALLTAQGIKSKAYHAGLNANERRRVQEHFSTERLDVVCATVAFGMGIDRSNVRCVVHAAMPKSIEAYQQETGRAGRDGLPAECVMLYSPSDPIRWKQLITRSADEAEVDSDEAAAALAASLQVQFGLLDQMQRVCDSPRCRHKVLSEYFGQAYDTPDCGACDLCLGELAVNPQGTEIARKIISCVFRMNQHSGNAFGAGHLSEVLMGANTERIRLRGHNTLTTFAQLKGTPKELVSSYINQLVEQGALNRTASEYPVIEMGEHARAVLKLERPVTLVEPSIAQGTGASGGTRVVRGEEKISDDPATQELFEELRALRRRLADERNVPPYVVFSDVTLREMASKRPGDEHAMLAVRGVGQRKLTEFGPAFLEAILAYCTRHNLTPSTAEALAPPPASNDEPSADVGRKPRGMSMTKAAAFMMFSEGATVAEVVAQTGRANSTVNGYLSDFIAERKPSSIQRWVPDTVYNLIVATAKELGTAYWMPIRDKAGEAAPVDAIFLVLAHLRAMDIDPTKG